MIFVELESSAMERKRSNMHNEIEFAVAPKSDTGKGAARKFRASGKTPGIVYAPDLEPVMVTFREQDLAKALSSPAGRNVFLRLKCEDERLAGQRVLVKDLQVDPVKRVFLHADFYRLDPERVIHAMVPIHLVGTAVGVKEGGIMSIARYDLSVACLPDDLPEFVEVDVTTMRPGDSIHVRDLQVPETVRVLDSEDYTVCAVVAPSKAEEEVEEEEEIEGELEGVEEAEEGEQTEEQAGEE